VSTLQLFVFALSVALFEVALCHVRLSAGFFHYYTYIIITIVSV